MIGQSLCDGCLFEQAVYNVDHLLPRPGSLCDRTSAKPWLTVSTPCPFQKVPRAMSQSGGPPHNIAELYTRYGPMVYRRILNFYSKGEAEEVLHEVFLSVLERFSSFRADASPGTWLYRVATNHCINRLRNQQRRDALLVEHRDELWYASSHGASQEEAAFLKQLWKQLPEELVQVGVFYFVDGLTHAEIARVMGVSRRTVGNRLEELKALALQHAGDASEGRPS